MLECNFEENHNDSLCFSRPISSRICCAQPKCDANHSGYRIPLLIDSVSDDNTFSQVYNP